MTAGEIVTVAGWVEEPDPSRQAQLRVVGSVQFAERKAKRFGALRFAPLTMHQFCGSVLERCRTNPKNSSP
jgi:hypothetical protein